MTGVLPDLIGGLFGLHFAYWTSAIIKVLATLIVVPTGALVLGYVFLLKMMSFMQSRLGPMEAGPGGSLQLLADGAKFLQKEDIFPDNADRTVFGFAPMVVLASTFLMFMVVPAGPDLVIAKFDTGIFFALAVSSLSVLGVLMAGWASANKYALMGGLRAAGQLIAYELPIVLAVVGVIIQAGSMNLVTIVKAQSDMQVFGADLGGVPYVVPQLLGFVIFLIGAQAELNQTPFDMPVAESELVAGHMTEYTGFRFLIFFLSEFGTAFAYAALAATLFLGGWYVPVLGSIDNTFLVNAIGIGVLFGKMMFVSFLIFWVRFSYPRFREDQLQAFAWKILIPASLANILLTAICKVAF